MHLIQVLIILVRQTAIRKVIDIFSEKKHKRYFFKEAPVNSVPLYPKYSPRIHKEADKVREKASDRIREFQLTASQGG